MTPEQKLGINVGIPPMIEKAQGEINVGMDLPQWAEELKRRNYLPEKVVIADPLSYCAGVVRADEGIEDMFGKYPRGFFMYHAPIHNDTKLEEWERRGAQLIHNEDALREIEDGSPLYISAHSIGPDIWEIIQRKKLTGEDASCPLVDKTHREVERLVNEDCDVLLFGNKDHDEMVGTIAIAPDRIIVISPNISNEGLDTILMVFEGKKFGIGSQTTLNQKDISEKIEYIKQRRPDVHLPRKEDICYASQNRQEAVVAAIVQAGVELMIIFGSDETKRQPSSNTIRLREISNMTGAQRAYIVEDISEIKPEWFEGISVVGGSAGASADPKRVGEFLICLREMGLCSSQLQRITVAEELQVFAGARSFDFSEGFKQ